MAAGDIFLFYFQVFHISHALIAAGTLVRWFEQSVVSK